MAAKKKTASPKAPKKKAKSATKKSASAKSPAKKAAAPKKKKAAPRKKTAAKKTAARKKEAAPKNETETKAAETNADSKKPNGKTPSGGGSIASTDVNLGHVFALRPRANTSFRPNDFMAAKRALSEERYATIAEAARAVAEEALSLTRGDSARIDAPPRR